MISFSTMIIALIISVILTILICYNFRHREIQSEIILTSLSLILLLLIWQEILPSYLILIPLITMGLNAIIIIKKV